MPIYALNVRESPELSWNGVEEHDSDVIFKTGSRNEPGTCTHIGKYAIWL